MKGLIYFSFLFAGCLADDLVTLSSKRVAGSQCCGGDHVLSCNLANVQLENLGTEQVNLPGDLTLDFLNNVNSNPNTYHYGSSDGEAVVTYNPNSNGLHGHALSTDGKSYVLEFCGSSGHVWKLLDTDNMPGEVGLELPTNRLALELPGLQLSLPEPEPEFASPELNFGQPEPEMLFPMLTLGSSEPESPPLTLGSSEPESPSLTLGSLSLGNSEPEFPSLSLGGGLTLGGSNPENYFVTENTVSENEELTPVVMPSAEGGEVAAEVVAPDNTTSVTYSVKFYYTPEFAADTADLDGFFDQVLAETNSGYENSEIPLKIVKHCAEEVSFTETGKSFVDLLNAVTYLNPQFATTRDGADAVALLVLNGDYCGLAWTNTLSVGGTFSVTKKSCATGYYSFSHEIGHNVGAAHDPATSTNADYSYAHGHLIAQGVANTGARTVMAYSATGHSTRVNYWSNPSVNHPITGTPTGVAGLSNNAALLTKRRYTLAALGDESFGNCKVATTTAPVTVAPATTAPVGTPVTVAPATTAPVGTPVTVAPATTAPVGTPVTVAPATTAPVGTPVTVAPATTAPVGTPVTVAPATTAPVGTPVTVAPGTTAPVGTPVTVAPATTAPVGVPVTVAPGTTAPVGVPVTVAPATTAPVGTPVTVAPATTAPVGVPVTVAPATTAPVNVPVTVAPVTAPVKCKKEAKSLKTMKKLKNVKTIQLCQKACQEKFMGGCVAFNHNKKKKTCQLMKIKYKKANSKVCTGRLAQKAGVASFNYNKEAKSLKSLKKFKMTLLDGNDYCQDKCQNKWGCVAFNVDKKKRTCKLLKLVVKKKKGTNSGTPYKL